MSSSVLLSVPCPYCKASVGEACHVDRRTVSIVVLGVHRPRARNAQQLPEEQVRCTFCKKLFVERNRKGRVGDRSFCSAKCAAESQVVHGQARSGSRSPTYRAWQEMHQRCSNPNFGDYEYYGGRGITVCERWTGDGGFQRFVDDVGERPSPKLSLDRYPNRDGNYEPGNVRWATSTEQNRNRSNVRLSEDLAREIRGRHEYGESITSIARRLGINRTSISLVVKGKSWKEAPCEQ